MSVQRAIAAGILVCLACSALSQEITFGEPVSSRSCETSSGQRGRCTDLIDCPEALQLIRDGGKPSTCRFHKQTPVVCCLKNGDSTGVRTVSTKLQVEAPKTSSIQTIIRVCGQRFPPEGGFEVFKGHPAQENSWPWMVLLGRRRGKRDDFFCGAAIINERYVITAAHCILSLEPFFARIAEHNYEFFSIPEEDFDIEDVIAHPKYDINKGYYDIALLKLEGNITFRDEVKPICLPWGDLVNDDLINKTVALAGWGKLGFSAASSPILQEANVTVFHPSVCSKSYSTLPDYERTFPEGMTPENVICAGHIEGTDSCEGDSGGPLMHYETKMKRYTLAAIISKGFGCGKKDYPGLNSPIRNHETLQWIKRVAFQ